MSVVFHPVGPDYCVLHDGIREEDEEACDFVEDCRSCDGSGDTYSKNGDVSGPCPDCDGIGVPACDLRPLGYMIEGGAS